MLAEVTPELAAQRAAEFGFVRSTGDWRELVADPAIDVVDICAPNFLHKEMALAAIAQGKHVYSEKPLALNAQDAAEMVQAARAKGVKTLVGFNYMKNPTSQLARKSSPTVKLARWCTFTVRIMKIIWPTRARRSTGTAAKPPLGWGRWAIWRRIS